MSDDSIFALRTVRATPVGVGWTDGQGKSGAYQSRQSMWSRSAGGPERRLVTRTYSCNHAEHMSSSGPDTVCKPLRT